MYLTFFIFNLRNLKNCIKFDNQKPFIIFIKQQFFKRFITNKISVV